jgi:hypothetical protein
MGENWDGSECKAPSTAGSLGVLGGLGSVEDVTSAIFAVLSQPFKIYLAFLKSPKAGCSLNFGSSMRAGVIQTVLVGQSGAARTHDKFVPH